MTGQNFQAVENKIREVIPEANLDLIVDNIGLPARLYNLAFSDGTTIGVNDGVIQVALKEGHAPRPITSASCAKNCRPPSLKIFSISRRRIWSRKFSISA